MFNPIKSIKSRYATTTISSKYYTTISVTNTSVSIGSGLTQGYIWLPYIMVDETQRIMVDETQRRKLLLEERKKKLEKLTKINN